MLMMRLCFDTFGEIIFSVISVMPMEFKSIIREFYISYYYLFSKKSNLMLARFGFFGHRSWIPFLNNNIKDPRL